MINNRLLEFLPRVVGMHQNGFVPSRFIIYNILTVNEAIERTLKEGSTGVVTFYDFTKAFDSVSHSAIGRTLKHLKVPHQFYELIISLVNAPAQVLVNGQRSPEFRIESETRHGDPMSPTLLALAIEPLTRMILNDSTI
ncbi:hypothetical protein CYY_000642 [Polysphondylium violaceum]|uniref:Reverse transcriptase domain-containing protein n=1 Tax=Polysphondylium violaceum TaxID=133409 RepID=A0A8J4UX08_9MYCE|nr:hypothetical protein CYY_000642 [Polysphondylium violaceum]